MTRQSFPVGEGWLDVDQLAQQVNWDHLTEMEKLLVANLQPDYDKLTEEVRQHPFSVCYRWGGGTTLLHVAANDAQLDLAKLLIDLGADPNARDVSSGTPLHAAAGSGNVELVDLLLRHGATVDALDGNGHTPLYRAAISHNDSICQLLTVQGAVPTDEYTRRYISEMGNR